jgi:hypothetical protein
MRTLFATILSLALLITANSHAAVKSEEQVQPSIEQIDQQRLVIAKEEEVKLLKNEIRILQSFQDNLLSTVYWSLGTLVTVAALLVGFGWLANFRIYERDKAELGLELENEKKERSREIENFRNELDRTKSQIPIDLKSLVAIEIGKLENAIPELIAKSNNELISKLEESAFINYSVLGNKVDRLSLAILELEYQKWIDAKVYKNALTTATSILSKQVELKTQWGIALALDYIKKCLLSIIGERGKLFPSDISSLVKQLDQLSTEHGIIIGSIKEALQRVADSTKSS